jgi:hypothetical protein
MSEADIQQQQPAEGAEAGAGEGFDTSAVMDRLEQLSGEVTGLSERIAVPEPEPDYQQQQYPDPYGYGGYPPPQQPQQYAQPQGPYGYNMPPQPSPQQVAQQFALDPANVYDDYGNVNPQAAAQYQRMLQEAVVNPAIQQAVQPIMEQLHNERIDRGAERLLQKYPEYNDKEASEGLVKEVREWAAMAGLDPQRAVENDAILEQHILVKRAQEQASRGGATAGEQTHELEAGQGAGPGGAPASFADQVAGVRAEMANGASQDTLNFWGIPGI